MPEPFAALLLDAEANRDNMTTATNPDSRWLFPARRAGQPLHLRSLLDQIRALGIPAQTARTATLRQLVLQVPAPVVAQALGYHPTTTNGTTPTPAEPGLTTPPASTADDRAIPRYRHVT